MITDDERDRHEPRPLCESFSIQDAHAGDDAVWTIFKHIASNVSAESLKYNEGRPVSIKYVRNKYASIDRNDSAIRKKR